MNIKITFDPPTYNGWKLEHYPSNDSPFRARKGQDFVSAESLPELCDAIRKAESELLLFDDPIKAMWKCSSPVSWIPVEFYAMREGRVFFRDERGEAHSEFVRNFNESHTRDKFRLINAEYPALAKKVDDAVKANQKAYQKAEDLKRRFAQVTADLFESVKVKAGKEQA
jgi:hypothetical protein